MNKIKNVVSENWYKLLVMIFIVAVFIFYTVIGENSYIAIHDNLDLFTPQFQMMKNEGIFFGFNTTAPFLHGITRNGLPSEFSLYTVLYMIFPSFTAYVLGYLLKIVIAIWSFSLMVKDILTNEGLNPYGNKNSLPVKKSISKDTDIIIWMCGFAYGILNLFPTFGIPFASIPLVIYIFRNLYRNPSAKWYVAAFLYPFLSYFSYFGMFILGYIVLAIIWLWIRDALISKDVKGPRIFKLHLSISMLIGLILLAAGCVVFEYRLFSMMLFSDTPSIKTTMVESSLSFRDMLILMADSWKNGMMHADDAHKYIVFPLCIVYFIILNTSYIVKKNIKGIFRDYFNLCMLLTVFNSAVYGIYYNEAFRNLIWTLVPPLEGWQFNRTIFFNPFVWYAALFIVCYRLIDKAQYISNNKDLYKSALIKRTSGFIRIMVFVLPLISIAAILLQNNRYNDLRSTAYGQYYMLRHDGQKTDNLSYGEFYSVKLFDKIKDDIGYEEGEWSLAYGLYPAVLEYNKVATLDGYLGFYSLDYKESFRKIIAPALELSESSRAYFDEWGARCYLAYSTDQTPNMATKSLTGLVSDEIYVDTDAIKELDGKYIFSRIDISNAKEQGLSLIGAYSDESSPYTIYVYEVE
ncbi:MAG: DUF6044 family protein [Butyrivibrio sp.]|nr:DUF6044 family protein [Butyrivibrio sp.]